MTDFIVKKKNQSLNLSLQLRRNKNKTMKIDPRDGINIFMFQLLASSTYVKSNNNTSNQLEIDIKIVSTFILSYWYS